MQNKWTEALGLTSAALTTAAFVPQVIDLWNMWPSPATAISLPMYAVFTIGVFGWLLYGIAIRSRPVLIANALVLVQAMFILAYKWTNG